MPPKTAGRTYIKVKQQVGEKVAEALAQAVPLLGDDFLFTATASALANAWQVNAASECSTVLRVKQTAYYCVLAAEEVRDESPALAHELDVAADKLLAAEEKRDPCG